MNKQFVAITIGDINGIGIELLIKLFTEKKIRNFILFSNYELLNNYFKKNKLNFDLVAGGETAGIPYAAFIAEKTNKPMIYVRKKSKGFGINQQIEGKFKKNDLTILIEDLATDGGSKILFVEAMRKAGLKVKDIFVIFYYDIFDFRDSELSKLNVNIHSLCTWKDIIKVIETKKIFDEKDIETLKFFLSNPNKWRQENA